MVPKLRGSVRRDVEVGIDTTGCVGSVALPPHVVMYYVLRSVRVVGASHSTSLDHVAHHPTPSDITPHTCLLQVLNPGERLKGLDKNRKPRIGIVPYRDADQA